MVTKHVELRQVMCRLTYNGVLHVPKKAFFTNHGSGVAVSTQLNSNRLGLLVASLEERD